MKGYNYLREKALEQNFPLKVFMEITYRCNFKCEYCYNQASRKTQLKEMSYSQACYVIDQLAEGGVLYLLFTGGEPFLREDICDLIEYAKKKRFAVGVISNGTLINNDIVKCLKENYVGIEISINGMSDESYKVAIDKPGYFKIVLDNIKRLKDNGIRLDVSCVATQYNFNERHKIKKLVNELGVRYTGFNVMRYPIFLDEHRYKHDLTEDQLRTAIEETPALRTPMKNFYPNLEKNYACQGAIIKLSITPDGHIKPCNLFPYECKSKYSIFEKDFITLWKENSLVKKLRMHRIKDYVCGKCDFLLFCYACPAAAFADNGDVFGTSERRCSIARLRKQIYLEHLPQ